MQTIPTVLVRVNATGHECLVNVDDVDLTIHTPVEPTTETKTDETDETDENLDTTPGDISTVNSDEAKVIVSEATLEQLDALKAAEEGSDRHPGGRKGVLKAIEDRRAELTSTEESGE